MASKDVDRIADAIEEAQDHGAVLRVSTVIAVGAGGNAGKVQLEAFGTAWLAVDTSVGLTAGDRVYALQQGPVVVVTGKLAGGVAGGGGSPVGSVTAFAGSTAPDGWLLCQGQSLARTDYPALFAVIGISYGTASSSTFSLPDLRNRVPVGASPKSLADTGGSETVTLTTAQMPSHNHGSAGSHSHGIPPQNIVASGSGSTNTDDTGTGGSTGSAGAHTHSSNGSGEAHPNMQPYLVLNYIIRSA